MKAPDFDPQFVKAWTWGSIGAGAMHVTAADFKDVDTFWDVWAQGEIGNPGGTAFAAAHSVALSLEKEPMESVSPILQIGRVRADKHSIMNLKRERHGAWSQAAEAPLTAGELITRWADFKATAAAAGLDANAAIT